MRHLNPILFVSLTLALLCSALNAQRILFNGQDFNGWETYLGPRYNSETKDFEAEHVGLNNDPDRVFTVVEVDGAPAIRISGEIWGGLSTLEEFENYHLRLQFKWGELRSVPRENSRRDSGLLYHGVGPHATGWFFWLRSQEFQVQEHDTGDYWAVGGASIKAHVQAEQAGDDTEYLFTPAGELTVFRSGADAGGRIRRSADAEFENGRWNTLDLYCLGQTSLHIVNGVLVNVLRESEQPDGNERFKPLTKGKIQLQSEGAEVFYRDITIEPIDRLPDFSVRNQE